MSRPRKCPLCRSKFVSQSTLEGHLRKHHEKELGGMSPARYIFNIRNNKTRGTCIICGKESEFNEHTKKYNRLCNRPMCRERYIKMFRERMQRKYGKTHLLDDPDVQKKMLARRGISGEYGWSDGTPMTFTGQYEEEFLKYCDIFLNLPSADVIAPCPFPVEYNHGGKKHIYLADFFFPSLDLVIEIKATDNKGYRERDIETERVKDKAMVMSNHHYLKVADKNYDEFLEGLIEGRWTKKKFKK